MSVTLDQIKELREMTGVSTMACKKALEEASGDVQKAIELLRKRGEAKSAALATRVAGEGCVAVKETSGKASMVSVTCETDFVSRGDDFSKLVRYAVEAEFNGNAQNALSKVAELSGKLGEKMEIRQHATLEAPNVGSYVHSNNKIGVIVSLSGGNIDVARDVAMQVAAMNPPCVSPDEVDSSLIESEKNIWKEQLAREGKPEAMIGKIMEGKERKFREEKALLTQAFIKNPEKTIQNLLGDVKVQQFVRFAI